MRIGRVVLPVADNILRIILGNVEGANGEIPSFTIEVNGKHLLTF